MWNIVGDARCLPEAVAERVRPANSKPIGSRGFVLYWMATALRAHDNPALDAACTAARHLGLPLLVYQGLSERYPYASDRHHRFVLECARDVHHALVEQGIRAVFHLERPGHRGPHLPNLAQKAALVVTEDFPTKPLVGWVARLAEAIPCALWCVDTACIAPMRLVGRAFDRAFAFREAVAPLWDKRLPVEWQDLRPTVAPFEGPLGFAPVDLGVADIAELIAECNIDHAVAPVPDTPGGTVAGYRRWKSFVDTGGLARYARLRNDAARPGVSRMSAYLHYGCVSPLRIARDALRCGGEGAEKFLDELLVWRELAYVFCQFRPHHDTVAATPRWAQASLDEHERDPRPALFSWDTLQRGNTGDELWDLAQQSLRVHGELHNNVRMTWGKALLQWTPNAEAALALLIDLNHRYALDGRDPASYGGLLWCLGQFDRPFSPPTPILGAVRARPTAGHAERLDLAAFARVVKRPRTPDFGKTLVIGAGVAGLLCARTLREHGAEVVVLDKGRAPGGRAATRRTDAGPFDHGAQVLTDIDRALEPLCAALEHDGVLARWEPRVQELRPDGPAEFRLTRPWWVPVPSTSALPRHLAAGLTVECGAAVVALEAEASGFCAHREGAPPHRARRVLLALPPAQGLALLSPKGLIPDLRASYGASTFEACWTLMLAFGEQARVDWDVCLPRGQDVTWISRETRKPGRRQELHAPERVVVHTSAEFASDFLEADPTAMIARLLPAVSALLGVRAEPVFAAAHRWRYARPSGPDAIPESGRAFYDMRLGVGACGDSFTGSGLGAAMASGVALAGRVLGAG